MINWGCRLQGLLEERRVTQRMVAEVLGVSPQAVNKWTADGEIEHRRLRDLARFLGVNWVWLRYGAEALAECMAIQTTGEARGDVISSELWARSACDALGLGVWGIDLRAGESYWSSKQREIIGVAPDGPVRHSMLREMSLPEDLSAMDGGISKVVNEGGMAFWRFRTRNKPEVPLVVAAARPHKPYGEGNYIAGITVVEQFIDRIANR